MSYRVPKLLHAAALAAVVVLATCADASAAASPSGTSPLSARLSEDEVLLAGAEPEPVRVFPIDGPHDLGRTATNGFGGGRDHKGQDMFAACGTPLVSVSGGIVRRAASDGVAGHHLVVEDAETGEDHVYMHLQRAPKAGVGDRVAAGEPLGEVGQSGNAQGCHLHFERWSAPGWQRGDVRDPLPFLRALRG